MKDFAMRIKAGIAAVSGCVLNWLGGLDELLIALIAVLVLDYATGLLAAWYGKALSSAQGFRGIAKKVMALTVVALAYTIESVTGGAFPLREITIMFFVVNESLSILENAAKTGLPIPDRIKNALSQLREKSR